MTSSPHERFDTLLATHGPALSRLAASYTRGAAEREDLLQEIAFAIWRALPRFQRRMFGTNVSFRIAHNRAISYLGRRQLPLVDGDEHLEVTAAAPDPEKAFSIEQEGQRLLDAIRRLPLPYAQVVTLTLEELSYAEIGEVLGISETNVGARLTRAREMLRTLMRPADGRS